MKNVLTPKKRQSKPKVVYKDMPEYLKRFNPDMSIFGGELGLQREDLRIMLILLGDIFQDEKLRVMLMNSKTYISNNSNLFRVKYKLETILSGKST